MISQNLILRYINGHTSEEETKEVVEWIKASEENQRSYMNIRKLNDLIIWNSDTDTKAKEPLQVVPYPIQSFQNYYEYSSYIHYFFSLS